MALVPGMKISSSKPKSGNNHICVPLHSHNYDRDIVTGNPGNGEWWMTNEMINEKNESVISSAPLNTTSETFSLKQRKFYYFQSLARTKWLEIGDYFQNSHRAALNQRFAVRQKVDQDIMLRRCSFYQIDDIILQGTYWVFQNSAPYP